jgi:hypothetical protein
MYSIFIVWTIGLFFSIHAQQSNENYIPKNGKSPLYIEYENSGIPEETLQKVFAHNQESKYGSDAPMETVYKVAQLTKIHNTGTDDRYSYTYSSDGYLMSLFFERRSNDSDWEYQRKVEHYPGTGEQVDSSYYYDWLEGSWVLIAKVYNTFDNNGNLINVMEYDRDNANDPWEYSYKTEYTLNADGTPAEIIYYYYSDSQWVPVQRDLHTYDSNGAKLTSYYDVYENGSFNFWSRFLYTNNSSGSNISYIIERWIDDAWQKKDSTVYQRDADDNILTSEKYQWNNDEWEAEVRYVYTYTPAGFRQQYVKQYYTNDWVNEFRSRHIIEGNKVTLTEKDYWENNQWNEYGKVEYELDAAGNTTQAVAYIKTVDGWIQSSGIMGYYYNDLNDFEIFTADSALVSYTTIVTGIQDDDNATPDGFTLSQNYPNPFNPSTVISYSLPSASNVSLKVYSLTGEEAALLFDGNQSAGTYQVNFNAGNLSSGIYFYVLEAKSEDGKEVYRNVKKMTLLR